MIRFAANLTMMFQEVPFLQRFEKAASCGFTAVEFLSPYDYPAEELQALLQRHALTLALFNTPAGNREAGERGFAALPTKVAEFRTGFNRALDYARSLGCRRLHVMSGITAHEPDRAACEAVWISNLRYAADLAAQEDIILTIEPLNNRDAPGYFLSRQDETLALIDRLGRTNVRLQFDYYHTQIMEGDLIRRTERLAGTFAHVQIASVPDRHEPDEGEVNYDSVFNTLEKVGYDGWIGCEYTPRSDTCSGLEWLRRVINSRQKTL